MIPISYKSVTSAIGKQYSDTRDLAEYRLSRSRRLPSRITSENSLFFQHFPYFSIFQQKQDIVNPGPENRLNPTENRYFSFLAPRNETRKKKKKKHFLSSNYGFLIIPSFISSVNVHFFGFPQESSVISFFYQLAYVFYYSSYVFHKSSPGVLHTFVSEVFSPEISGNSPGFFV